MSRIDIRLLGDGECAIRHLDSDAEIRSSKSPELGGRGGAFSSTDLLAAALGSCIATNIEPVALRHGLSLDAFEVSVDKRLRESPKAIESLQVGIRITSPVRDDILERLKRAAGYCLVHRSLSESVEVAIRFSN